MYKKRVFVEGAFYHVTTRTNNKIHAFETISGKKIMEITLIEAKEKFNFQLTNFCVMPTHIHLLIKPKENTQLSDIMHQIKRNSAKRWNITNYSSDHLWGKKYFSRAVIDDQDYENVMNYIKQNPVKEGLAAAPEEWEFSGAFHKFHGLTDLVD